MGSRAQGLMPTISLPPCDSPEVEAAALVAQDFLNAQHTHGYKYVLNQIDKVRIVSTAIEADCDFVVTNATQGLSVVAFKCKTETESEDECVGCPQLISFNDTNGLQLIETSLDHFNKNNTLNRKFALLEIGRMGSQTQAVDPASNATVRVQQLLHAHTFGPQHNPAIHDLKHHKLTALHDPSASGLLSAESIESSEEVVVPKEAPIVKREVVAPEVPAADLTVSDKAPLLSDPILLVPICPGKKKHF
ncbi:alpha-2-HS-glyco -like protein [Labeo rohita]|uniref:Alpha-2-HS-glyco-like protein n=1 Tax=Labeo rohita TaxID=84645 RepID=A0A498N4I5_LABRO|nr:alpha-2-HS-glyco -like protein [Labeo rohita]